MPREVEGIKRVKGKLFTISKVFSSSPSVARLKYELPSNETCVYHVKLTIIHKGRFMRT